MVGLEKLIDRYRFKEHQTCARIAWKLLKWGVVRGNFSILERLHAGTWQAECIRLKFDSCPTLCDDCALILILHMFLVIL